MRAIERAEDIYIQTGLTTDHTVAIYSKATNTLEIHEGRAKLLPKILKTLRALQRLRNMVISPIKVEYW
jgi:hypothetical protein